LNDFREILGVCLAIPVLVSRDSISNTLFVFHANYRLDLDAVLTRIAVVFDTISSDFLYSPFMVQRAETTEFIYLVLP
jgi:hypothetical protein